MNPKFTSLRRSLLAGPALALAVLCPALAQTARFGTLQTGNARQPTMAYDGLLVSYRDGTRARIDANAAAASLKAATATTAVRSQWNAQFRQAPPRLNRVRRIATGADLVRPTAALTQEQLDSLMQALRADPAVAHVEPNLVLKPVRSATQAILVPGAQPNDPNVNVQWHMRTADGHAEHTETDKKASFPNHGGIDAISAWQYGDGKGVVVAVIDTGITRHPDLDTSLAAAGYDFISDALNSGRKQDGRAAGGWDLGDWTSEDKYLAGNGGCVQSYEQRDSSWHGTHVAGTIAELTNNKLGMIGVAPKAKVLPVRALGHCGGTTADIADAIVWASGGHVDGVPDNQNPAEVINMSLGGVGSCSADSVTARAIAGAIARGTTVVVAAGNDASNAGSYTPASCPGVIDVAATGITGKRASYSNYGNSITLSAPGGGTYRNDDPTTGTKVRAGYVWSSLNKGSHAPGQATYAGLTGTSMATPHVTGAVALVISAAYAAGKTLPSPQQIREILTQTSTPFAVKPAAGQRIGAGILDAGKAAARAAGAVSGGDEASAVRLSRGQLLRGQSAKPNATQLFRIDVPANARNLQIRTLGGAGQVKMYVRVSRAPGADGRDADASSLRAGTVQNMQTAQPVVDSYFIRLVGGQGGYRNINLIANYSGS